MYTNNQYNQYPMLLHINVDIGNVQRPIIIHKRVANPTKVSDINITQCTYTSSICYLVLNVSFLLSLLISHTLLIYYALF